MQFARVIFPFDYSDRCRQAAPFVKNWVQKSGAGLTIINVIEDPGEHYPASARFLVPPKEKHEILTASSGFLRKFASETFPGITVDAICKMGDPAREITCLAAQTRADLIMMPTRGCGRFRALLLGSVTAKVLNDAECPVWTDAHMDQQAPEQEREIDTEIHTIVCAVDDKQESISIIKSASDLADLYSATLHLLHVVPEIDVRNKTLKAAWQQELKESGWLQIGALRQDAGVTAEIHVESGSVSHTVRKAALECNAGLVVIGRGHAQGLLGRLRTNAYAIIRDSPCPVLSI